MKKLIQELPVTQRQIMLSLISFSILPLLSTALIKIYRIIMRSKIDLNTAHSSSV